jgi:chromosomal replication initiation ATPase DnaA
MSRQHILPLQWSERYDAASFLVADCNRAAYDVVNNLSQWSAPVLVLLGEKGSGKTHLVNIFRQSQDATLIENIADIEDALQKQGGCFAVDDADTFGIEDKLFHLFNHIAATKGHLLLAMNRPAKEWVRLPDLLSRLNAAPIVTVDNPDEEMIKNTYQKLFMDRGLFVDDKVLDYLTLRTERSFAGIRATVDALDKASLETKRRVTIPLVQSLEL